VGIYSSEYLLTICPALSTGHCHGHGSKTLPQEAPTSVEEALKRWSPELMASRKNYKTLTTLNINVR
jgi:hypothetical protein